MPEELTVVGDLSPTSRNVNIIVKVVKKGDVKEIISRKDGSHHRVGDATVGDETGIVLLTLWDDMIEKLEVDHIYKIRNSFTSIFKGSLRLNLGRYGTIEEMKEKEIDRVNTENNLSEKRYEVPRFREPQFKPLYSEKPSRRKGWRR
ncbi:MAG: hypothetical protein HY929_06685 [Euryarchaeota archaeon]|nr:hypothetical protein [Euryarchaeota archaeon]